MNTHMQTMLMTFGDFVMLRYLLRITYLTTNTISLFSSVPSLFGGQRRVCFTSLGIFAIHLPAWPQYYGRLHIVTV